jgi:hypothetical protein
MNIPTPELRNQRRSQDGAQAEQRLEPVASHSPDGALLANRFT